MKKGVKKTATMTLAGTPSLPVVRTRSRLERGRIVGLRLRVDFYSVVSNTLLKS